MPLRSLTAAIALCLLTLGTGATQTLPTIRTSGIADGDATVVLYAIRSGLFRRAGLEGRLLVEASAFDLTARLGLLLGAFRGQIEEGIEDNLDRLLATAAAAKKGATTRATGIKAAAKKP